MPKSGPPALPSKAEGNVRLLAILFALEMLLGIFWTISLISKSGQEQAYLSLTLLTSVYPIHLVCMAIAGASIRKYPPNLKFAIPVLTTPILFLVLPPLINFLAGGAPALRSPEQIRNTVLVLILIVVFAGIFFPRKIARFLPNFLLRSFWLNLGILCVPLFVYVTYGIALAKWKSFFTEAASEEAGYMILYGLLFAYMFAVATIIPVTLTFLYSYIGLFQSRVKERRGMRVVQLILSLPAILLGIWIVLRIVSEGNSSV